jgi:hypothetical protein
VCGRAISVSMAERMSCVFIPVRYQSVRQSSSDAVQGNPGATEQKIRLRNQESSSIASDELRRGRSCPHWTASGTEKA